MAPRTKHYVNLPDVDDHDNRSSTEVEEGLMHEEKHWHSIDLDASPSPKKTWWKQTKALLRRYRWLIDTLLLLTNIGLSLGLSLLMYYQFEDAKFPVTVRQVGGDYTGAGPMLGSGWKWVGNDPFFTTSMTHQLHCIFMMGNIFSGLTTNNMDKVPTDYVSHYFHCVDYLRQAVMCSGDVALEPHEITDSDDNGPQDGSWNGQHVCKDYSQVMKYLDKQIAEGVRVVLPIDD
ncbi:hypothetical protein COL26b_012576 [Colletotrichum chrysophilum]|uniref:uncharacterized protein n=1 Tax=Colletotrichum chrysophilum TaxID=1836956 RepID=UPI0022FFFDB1|nr:uncharacterized protein COL26b_012576 [Colletotrichum chrysophilum]KAJ0364294.1 hypothetical protein COL26b_012576 [Colletotrichum chrysophilum]